MKIKKYKKWVFSSLGIASLISVISLTAVACSKTSDNKTPDTKPNTPSKPQPPSSNNNPENQSPPANSKPNEDNEINPQTLTSLNTTVFSQFLNSPYVGQFYNNGILDLSFFPNINAIAAHTFINFQKQYNLPLKQIIINNDKLTNFQNVFDTSDLTFFTNNETIAQALFNLKTQNKIFLNNVLFNPDSNKQPENNTPQIQDIINAIPSSINVGNLSLNKLSPEEAIDQNNWNNTLLQIKELLITEISKKVNINYINILNFSFALTLANNSSGSLSLLVSVNDNIANQGLPIYISGFKQINNSSSEGSNPPSSNPNPNQNKPNNPSTPDHTIPTPNPDQNKPSEPHPIPNPDQNQPDSSKPDENKPNEPDASTPNPDQNKPSEPNPSPKPDQNQPEASNPDQNKPSEPAPTPDQNQPEENNVFDYISEAGTLSGTNLFADSYAPIISYLNLQNFTILSSLTNQGLNNLLKNTPFNNVNVSVANGTNEQIGRLNLNINGSYFLNGKTINIPQNAVVSITGFYHLDNNSLNLKIINNTANPTNFNLINYFSSYKTISYFSSPMDFAKWLPYFSNFYVSFINNETPVNFVSLFNTHPNSFNNLYTNFKISLNTNHSIKNISFLWTPSQFNNGSWIKINNTVSNSLGFPITITNASILNVPSQNDALNYYLNQFVANPDNKNTYVSQAILKNVSVQGNQTITDAEPLFFPSAYLSLKQGFDLDKFQQVYFNNQPLSLSLISNNQALINSANDSKGTLSFTVAALIDNNQANKTVTRQFTLNNFKKLSDVNNLNVFATLSKDSSSYKMLVNFIKKNVNNISSTGLEVQSLLPFIGQLKKQLVMFNIDASEIANQTNLNFAKKIFGSLELGNWTFINNVTDDSDFNYENGLINQEIGIKSMIVSSNSPTNGTVKKVNSYYTYTYPISITIQYFNESVTYNTLLSVNIFSTALN